MSYLRSFTRASLIGSLIFSSCAMAAGQEPDQPKKVVISFEVADGPIRIVIRGDDVKVELDGKEIAEDRVEIEENWLQIKNKSGWPVAFGNFSAKNFGLNFVDTPKMHAWLGVDLRSVSDALAGHLDLDQDEVSLIVSVTPDSPAEKGGLLDHDIILSFDGKSPATGEDLREVLEDKKPGDMLEIGILRKGKERELEIELGESASSSWAGTGFNRLLFGGIGKGGVYTAPNIKGSWPSPKVYKFDKATNAYKYQMFNQLLQGKKKGKGSANPFTVITPDGLSLDQSDSRKGGLFGAGRVYTTGKGKTVMLPESQLYSFLGGAGKGALVGTKAKGAGSTDALEKQLKNMSKQLEVLKSLVEKQQAKAKRRDN